MYLQCAIFFHDSHSTTDGTVERLILAPLILAFLLAEPIDCC